MSLKLEMKPVDKIPDRKNCLTTPSKQLYMICKNMKDNNIRFCKLEGIENFTTVFPKAEK